MPENEVFAALADPTRRQLVDWLSREGSGTATAFAARLPMSRQAVAKHLKELESAGLVVARKQGRETRFSLNAGALSDASDWLERRAIAWDRTLQRLREHLE